MKSNKSTLIIFILAIVTITATTLIFFSKNHSNQPTQKSSTPATVENITSKPIQSPEPVTEKPEVAEVKPEPKQLSKATPKTDKAAKPAIPPKIASVHKATMPAETTTFIPVESESVPEAVAEEGQRGLQIETATGWYKGLGGRYGDSATLPEELKNGNLGTPY
jgi:type IV secretory pathway VirB10-like protein